MANKSFVIQYVIKAREQYVKVADKVKAATDRMHKSSKDYMRTISAMGPAFRKLGAGLTIAVTTPIALLGRSMIAAASDAVETANKFNSVFDDVRTKANQVADDFSRSFGVAASTSRRMIGNTGDLLVGFGFTGDAALDLSKKVNELASDLASFQNFEGGAEGASVALTKALLGETESAKSLGIVIRQGTPEFKANVAAIMKSQGATLLQAKALEILRISQEQSRKAIGDVSRTWDDYANVQRRSAESNLAMRESFGKLLLPLATKVAGILTKINNYLANMSPTAKRVTLAIVAFVAVLGPLLLVIGAIIAMIPAFTAGMAVLGGLSAVTIGPIALAVAALAAAAVLVVRNWSKIRPVLQPLFDLANSFGDFLVKRLERAWNIVKGIGEFIGQVVAAITSLDFSNFDLGSIKDKIFGGDQEETARKMVTTRRGNRPVASSREDKVDVGVTVGLDKGLTQTTPTAVTRSQVRRRRDVGAMAME